jgi:hypothetical protein
VRFIVDCSFDKSYSHPSGGTHYDLQTTKDCVGPQKTNTKFLYDLEDVGYGVVREARCYKREVAVSSLLTFRAPIPRSLFPIPYSLNIYVADVPRRAVDANYCTWELSQRFHAFGLLYLSTVEPNTVNSKPVSSGASDRSRKKHIEAQGLLL